MWWILVASAWSAPTQVAAVGESWQQEAGMPGWSGALHDCLQERAPGRFAVIDRTAIGSDPTTINVALADQTPDFVVVGIAHQLTGLDAQLAEWQQFAEAHKQRRVLLVGPVPSEIPTSLSASLTTMAASMTHALHLDLQATLAPASAAPLFTPGALTARGHALLAALLCDEILRWRP